VNRPAARPIAWIVATAIFAIATVGLGIYALTTKSDLDDSDTTVARQNKELAAARRQLAGQEQKAASTEAKETAFGRRAERAYRRVRRRLISAKREDVNLEGQISREVSELRSARAQVEQADNATEKADAQLKASQQETDVAAACARGTLDSINKFFGAASATVGANRAMRQLERLQPLCQKAAGG
jgi:chromosome segregation ATPase